MQDKLYYSRWFCVPQVSMLCLYVYALFIISWCKLQDCGKQSVNRFFSVLCYHQIVTVVTQNTVLRKFMGLSSANVLVMRRFLFSNFGCVVLEMNGKANIVYIYFIVVLYLREISKHKICFCIDAVFTYRCRHFVASFTSNNPDMPCDIQFSLLCCL